MKPPPEADAKLLDRFADGLWLNDGLARNTLESYRRDIAQFAAWLQDAGSKPILQAAPADLQRHLAWQVERKRAKPRTTGRLVSSLKRFFQFAPALPFGFLGQRLGLGLRGFLIVRAMLTKYSKATNNPKGNRDKKSENGPSKNGLSLRAQVSSFLSMPVSHPAMT